MSLFPHQQLEWSVGRLERQLQEAPHDGELRLRFAVALWARGHFHGGGREALADALAESRRVLQQRPADDGALIVGALAMIGLGRHDTARRQLDQALAQDPRRADLHYALALWHRATGPEDRAATHEAVVAAEEAVRLGPDAWETHALLSEVLWVLVQQRGGPGRQRPHGDRAMPRSLFHAIRALELAPPTSEVPSLLCHVGVTCLHTGRFDDASRVLARLTQEPSLQSQAQYYLGLVHFQMGHFKNAILYLRKHLRAGPAEPARVHARIGMAHLRLGELDKARAACEEAITLDPGDLQSRWTLGCALLEEGQEAEALRVFKGILTEAPDHAPAFRELARAHARRGEVGWLEQALTAEVQAFDRVGATGETSTGLTPRQATAERIEALVAGLLDAAGAEAVPGLLRALQQSGDERLRMMLWEGALAAMQRERASAMARKLTQPGRYYGAKTGRQVLALASSLSLDGLVGGLQIDDEDLARAAMERHAATADVRELREAKNHERREARAWQALLLLAIATHGREEARPLLEQWAREADRDLGDAARAALILLGDADATAAMRQRAAAWQAENLVDAMVSQVKAPAIRTPVRAAAPHDERVCATCGRHREDVAVMLVGDRLSICDQCLAEVARAREKVRVDDPDASCELSHRAAYEVAEMYWFKGVHVCAEVVDHGLTIVEQGAVDRFLRDQA